jgi:predicted metal-dependent hydrolase
MDDNVLIIRRPVKHARLKVHEDASVQLVVPNDFSDAQVDAILTTKGEWIRKQERFFRTHSPQPARFSASHIQLFDKRFRFVLSPQLGRKVVVDTANFTIRSGRNLGSDKERTKWLRTFARLHLKVRLDTLSNLHRLQFQRLFVLSQRTRWGACSPSKNISLNWQLIYAPPYVADYVMLHELLHTVIPNHTQRFWTQLSAICPDMKQAVQWLQKNKPEIHV